MNLKNLTKAPCQCEGFLLLFNYWDGQGNTPSVNQGKFGESLSSIQERKNYVENVKALARVRQPCYYVFVS